MTKKVFAVLTLCLALALTANAAVLKVDFNATNNDGILYNQDGFESYQAAHEVASDFITATYGQFSITPNWTNTTDNRVRQMIDRSDHYDASWDNSNGDLDLVTDFIGIDTRTQNGGNGNWDGTIGTPTYMTLTITGLDAGDYNWISFHHDTEHVFGAFAVWASSDGGATFTQLADGMMTDGTAGGNPDSAINGIGTEAGPDAYSLASTYRTTITSDGVHDVVMRFAPYAANAVHQQIWGMNGFEITPVPEPVSSLLMLTGLSVIIRKRRQS